jgi:hypothetical protein
MRALGSSRLFRLAAFAGIVGAAVLLSSVLTVGATQVTPAYVARARTACDLFAAPWGSNSSGRGTPRRPYRSLTKLDRALSPGQTGCLRGGSYGGLTAWHRVNTNGTGSARITIREYPGETATVKGWVDLEGSYTTLEDLRIDGSNTRYPRRPPGVTCPGNVSQPLTISGHNDVLQHLDYFQSISALRSAGIGIGFWGDADDTVIRDNRIHDVGGCEFYDHLIYLASGRHVQIYGNWMWNDPHGWGVKLDPGPQDARVWGNVIDRAGSGFNFGNSSGRRPTAGNLVFDNIVVNSTGVSNTDIPWSYPGVVVTSPGLFSASTGNQVFDNDSYNNPGGITDLAAVVERSQLLVRGNRTIRPDFKDADAHDYALASGVHAEKKTQRRQEEAALSPAGVMGVA